MLLASHDVKCLRRLLAVQLRRGAIPSVLIAQVEKSIDGLYMPKGRFEDRDLDVAYLAKALGGPRLLYALSQSHGFASVSTVHRHFDPPQLVPCITRPTAEEISKNITAMCDPKCRPPMLVESKDSLTRRVAGLILMMDGLAIEERCRFLGELNRLVGLCREHGMQVPTTVHSFESILEVEAALHAAPGEEVCHYGKDATVAAVAPYARTDHYSPVPILLSASCKKENGEDLAEWLQILLTTWKTHPLGERTHGPIWSLASDGESSFRRARFLMCMSESVPRLSPLGQILYRLRGLNFHVTGSEGVTGTCDPKHVFERERSTRSRLGSSGVVLMTYLVHRLCDSLA